MNKNTKTNKRSSVSSDTSSYASISFSTSNNKSMAKKRKETSDSSQDISSETHGSSKRSVGRRINKNKRSRNGSVTLVKKDQKENKNINPYKGICIDYNEPPEAKEPKKKWRLCPVKYNESVQTYGKSVYLIGRLRKVVDIPISHPTCSKQHAALQYRLVKLKKNDGTFVKVVRPYLIDLDSVNGTYINNNRIESRKYIELHQKDVIKFGNSSVQYVLLHESNNNGDNDDDDLYEVENISVKKEVNY